MSKALSRIFIYIFLLKNLEGSLNFINFAPE